MRHEYLQTAPSYKNKLVPYMDKLEESGKWRKVGRTRGGKNLHENKKAI